MTQKNEVLTREDNRISLSSTKRTTTQEDYPPVAERELPVNTTEQTCIFEVGEKTSIGRTTANLVNTFEKIMKWLNHVGSGKMDDSYLESRHNIHHNFRMKGIGL